LQGASPTDPLAAERIALRLEALCALGRHDDARAEAAALARARPGADADAVLAERCPAARRR
jgi:hypothetical protein